MVREILKIKTDNGLANNPSFKDIEITEYSFRSPRMGMPVLTATLMWPTCLDDEWTGKEYVELRGEKYYIRQTQSSEKDNTDARYKHSLEFKSEREQLAHVFFYDVVPSWSATYDRPNTNSTEFKFFGTLREFADRMNCALRYAGIGDSILNTKTTLTDTDTPIGDGYCVVVSGYGGADLTISKELSFTDQYLWDALAEGFNQYEVPFSFHGKKIVFNEYIEVTEHVFKYGYDNSLLSVRKNNANARIINRITFKGSSENIPYYYPNETEYGHISLAPLSTNKVLTASNFTLLRPNRLVGIVTSGQNVTLQSSKRISATFGSMQYYNGSSYQTLQYGKWYEVDNSLASGNSVEYKYRTTFTLASAGDAAISSVIGQLWMTDKVYPNAAPTVADNLINSETFKVTTLTKGSDSYLSSVSIANNEVVLSKLPAGTYTIEFVVSWRFSLRAFWQINSISSASSGTTEYYWSIGEKRVKDLSSIGVSFNGTISDAAVGDGFGWTANGLMPFQANLMPPKYRQTLGTERFYNALNNTYPAAGGGYLTFKNPFVAGNPNEYIHTDDTIKPTIKGITNAAGQAFGVIADIAYDSDDNDSIKNVSDDKDKNDAANYEHSFFYVKLNKFDGAHGFDLFSSASQTDPMTIQMTSGKCNGCKFKIQVAEFTDGDIEVWKNPVQVTGANGNIVPGSYKDKVKANNPQDFQQDTTQNSIWICVQKDTSTFGVVMPNRTHNYMPEVGDTFNIINIDLPQGYITAAEELGESLMLDFMADNNEEKFNFDISASRIFFAENKELLASLNENSRIRIEYNGYEYIQYVSEFGIDCKDNEALPDVKLSLANTLTAGSSFVEEVVAKAVDAASVLGGRGGGGGGGLNTELADKRYIRKDKDDRTEHRVSSDTAFEVGSFTSGSSGGILFVDPDTGHSTLEVDFIKARMKAMFETLEIAHVQSIGGKLIISPGGSVVISFVEERANAYRCYFKQQEEQEGADCRFIVGDDCYCQSFNISAGTHHNASNQFYWRAVTAVSNIGSYIELSKTDCAAQSGVPQVGDTICQLGSDDETRQSAIVLSTVDTASPNVTLYDGITNFTLSGKEVVDYGVDPTTNKAYFHVYGNAYIGDKEGQSYVKYDNLLKKMEIKAMLSIQSTIGDDSLEDYIKKVSPPVKQEDIEDFVNAIVDPKIDGIQNQIDGVIETWFYNGVPTLTNYPASGWNTNDLKIQHLGDLYYDNDTGTAYRFSQNAQGAYCWNKITDEAITKALAAAQKAQDTADGKRRVFTSQPTNADVYDVGDLWVNATYGTQYKNDILRCIAHKGAGAAFSIAHWTLASKYTDDTALNNFITGYQTTIADIKTQVDGKAETWYQATNPASAWTTAADKTNHKGDLWYCTADIAGTNYKKGTTWYWNGTAWEKQDIPQSVFDTIDGKAEIFVSKPTSGYKKNDLWFLEADYTLSGVAYKAGTLVVAKNDMGTVWSANDWVKKDRYTDDTLAQQAIQTIAGYQYLKNALLPENQTQITGGLIISTLMSLGYVDSNGVRHAMAGMNGSWVSSLGGRTIGSWWGGPMVDLFDANDVRKSLAAGSYAKSMVRMDGSAYWANGNIGFRADGSGWLGNDSTGIKFTSTGAMTFGSGVTFDVTNVLGLKTTLDSLANFNAGLTELLEPVIINANGSITSLSWSQASQANAVRAKVGLYSDSFVSARGVGSSAGGSGGGGTAVNLLTSWGDYTTAMATTHALSAGLGYDLYSRVGALENGGSLNAFNLAQSGSGNAVTALSLSSDKKTLTVTKGANYTPWATRTVAYVSGTNLPNEIFNIENETLVPNYYSYWRGINLGGYSGGNYGSQIVMPYQNSLADTEMFIRTANAGTWRTWRRVLHDGNASSLLGNSFVTLSTAQTISGAKTFTGLLTIGTAGAGAPSATVEKNLVCLHPVSHTGGPWYINSHDTSTLAYLRILYKATQALRLRSNGELTAASFVKSGGTSSQFLMADGSVNSNKYLTSQTFSFENSSAGYVNVRFTNGTANQNAHNGYIEWWATNIGWFNHRAQRYEVTGGTSSQFLKADGSLDSNSYLTTSSASSTYVKKAGDTMTGRLAINTFGRTLTIGSRNGSWAHYETDAPDGHWFNKNVSVQGEIYAGSSYNQKVWHAGNDGSGSGLDADLLDGFHLDSVRGYRVNHPSINTALSVGYVPFNAFGMQHGTPMYNDPEFASGNNSVGFYNNAGNGNVVITRIADSQSSANSSGYILQITVMGAASPGLGGFCQPCQARANAVFMQIFRAKIPVGYRVNQNSNNMGSGYSDVWITSQEGTGKWEWYARITYCGASGTFSTGGYVSLYGTTPTASAPLYWYLSHCQVWDLTKNNYGAFRAKFADALSTARTIWGQSFDGTGDVSGNMTGVGKITSGGQILSKYAALSSNNVWASDHGQLSVRSTSNHTLGIGASEDGFGIIQSSQISVGAIPLLINPKGGNVGIGTTSPAYKLDVSGTIRATDSISTAGTCGQWISGKTNAAIKFNGLNAIDASSAWYLFNMKSSSGNTIAFGGLGNNIGFYTFLSSLTTNTYSSSFLCDTNTGKWSLADLRVTNSLQIGSVTISYDSANGALKIDGAAYTTGWLSGKGVGSSASGSAGSVNLLTAWSNYTTSMANTHALSAGLGYDLHTRLQNVYAKGTCDGRYGSTLTISGSTLTLKSPDGTSLKSVTLPTSSGSGTVSLGITNSGTGNAVTSITASGTTLTVTKGSTFSLSSHTHSNYGTTLYLSGNTLYLRNGSTNIGSSVTLPTSSGTTGSYLPLSGGTMTGKITLPASSDAIGNEYLSLRTTSANPLLKLTTSSTTFYVQAYYDSSRGLGLFLGLTAATSLMIDNTGNVHLASGKKLYIDGVAVSTSSSTSVKSLYADSKLCATALSTGGIAVYGSITNGSTSTTSNIGNSITSFNAGYFRSVYVNGTAVTSDARLKTIIGDVSLTVEQIAHAPAVNFIWKENGLRSAGSIAQYWRTYLPDTVNVDDMGDKLYLDYSRAALLSAIVTARRVLTVEEKLKLAEARIDELENKIAQYERNNEE